MDDYLNYPNIAETIKSVNEYGHYFYYKHSVDHLRPGYYWTIDDTKPDKVRRVAIRTFRQLHKQLKNIFLNYKIYIISQDFIFDTYTLMESLHANFTTGLKPNFLKKIDRYKDRLKVLFLQALFLGTEYRLAPFPSKTVESTPFCKWVKSIFENNFDELHTIYQTERDALIDKKKQNLSKENLKKMRDRLEVRHSRKISKLCDKISVFVKIGWQKKSTNYSFLELLTTTPRINDDPPIRSSTI